MSKDCPASPKAGERDVEFANTLLVKPIINFGVGRTTPSKQNRSFRRLTNLAAGTVAGGRSISEMDLQPLCGKYRADSLRALRRVHQCYHNHTRLYVEGGLWTLSPIAGGC